MSKVKWEDIPVAAKMTTAVVSALAGVVIWAFTTFETSDAAEQKWSQHNQAIACRTVYEWQEKIRAYLDRLRYDTTLTAHDRRWIEQEIESLKANIARLDPRGVC